MVLLGGPDFCYARPERAATQSIGGDRTVVVAFTFLPAGHAGEVDANGMMAVCHVVPAHIVCVLERMLAAIAAAAAATAATSA